MSHFEKQREIGAKFIEELAILMQKFSDAGLGHSAMMAALASMIRGCLLDTDDEELRRQLSKFIADGEMEEGEDVLKNWDFGSSEPN